MGGDRVCAAAETYIGLVEIGVGLIPAGGGCLFMLERVLDEATGRFPALLTGVGLGAGAALDADLLADRVVKLPGDREAQVAGALGELISYLEFEIKNHPQIPNPDERLESVGELRAAVSGT